MKGAKKGVKIGEVTSNSPYYQWNEIGQLAYLAAKESYAYDYNLKTSTGELLYTGKIKEAADLYRSNERTRTDIIYEVNEDFSLTQNVRTFPYSSELSTDQLAVYADKNRLETPTLLLGFRGTDPTDPLRFLGFLPHDFHLEVEKAYKRQGLKPEEFKSLQRYPPNFCSCTIPCEEESKQNRKLKYLYKTTFIAEATAKYGTLAPQVFLGYETRDYVKNRERYFDKTNDIDFTGGGLVSNVLGAVSSVGSGVVSSVVNVGKAVGSSVVNTGIVASNFYDCTNATFTPGCDITSDTRCSCVTSIRSDFNSDLILGQTTKAFTNALFNVTKNGYVMKDIKHEEAAKSAERAYENWKNFTKDKHEASGKAQHERKTPKIIISGHSLGGSLGFYAYYHLKKIVSKPEERRLWFKAPEIYFVGLNPATLKNYDILGPELDKLDKDWKNDVVVYRKNGDIVSRAAGNGEGSYIPSFTYTIKDPVSKYSLGETHSVTHGLETFKMCEGKIFEVKIDGKVCPNFTVNYSFQPATCNKK
jgi:hypothetical protein